MKLFRFLLLVLPLSAGSLRGDGFELLQYKLPDRPGLPVAYVDGKRETIVDFKGNNPVVVIGGVRVTKRGVPVSLVPGGTYGEGQLNVAGAGAVEETYTLTGPVRVGNRAYTLFNAKITADRDMRDVFMVLLVFEAPDGSDSLDKPRVALLGVHIGHLEAGRAKSVDADFPPLSSERQLNWAVCFFNGGLQVHSTQGNETLNALFDIMDRIGLRNELAKRSTGEFPMAIYRHFPLQFSDETKKRFAKRTVNVRVHVASDGTLDLVDSDDHMGSVLSREITGQLAYWLYLPRVKDGQSYPSIFILPLQF